MNQIKKGAVLSYFNIVLTNALGLILTPFIVKSLGSSEFGLYTLLGSLVAQLSLLNLGLNNTVVRFVAKYRAENKLKEEQNFLATIMLLYLAISAAILIIGLTLYFRLDNIFGSSLTTGELERAKPLFLILILNLALTLPGGTFEAVSNAYENFVFPRAVAIVKYFSRAILIFALLSNYPSAFALVWIDTALNVLVIGFNFYFIYVKLGVRFKLYSWNWKLLAEVFSYSIWIFVYAVAYNFQWQSGQTILGLSQNTTVVAIFGIGIMLGGYYAAFAGAINSLLLPRATAMIVRKSDNKVYTEEIIKIGSINIVILFFILTGFFLFGKQFIVLWVGKMYLESWSIAILIMLALTLPLIIGFGNSILEGMKKNRFKAILSLITLIIAVIIAYFASLKWGMLGVIYPIVIAVILNNIAMLFYYKKVFEFQIVLFLKKVFLKPVFFCVIMTFIWYEILTFWIIETWISLLLGILLYSITYVFLNYFIIINEELKQRVLNLRR